MNTKTSKGFTVVELLVVLPIVIVLGSFLAYLFAYQYRIFNTQSAELSIASDARLALDDVDTYVRQANRVAASYSSYTTGPQTLVLQLQAINSSGQVISGVNDMVVFYVSGTSLIEKVFPGTGSSRIAVTRTIANNVDVATFSFGYNNATYSSATVVQTNLALRQTMGGQVRSISISSKATLRNY